MTEIRDWQGGVGDVWAQEWRRTDRSFSGLTDHLLGLARDNSICRVLDIGCGAGELSLALGRTLAGAEIVGLDISESLVDVARARGEHLSNISFEQGDASKWERAGWEPDLILSRHGVMFFADPVGSFSHLRKIAAPSGRLVFSCFRKVAENVWTEKIAELLPPDTSPKPDAKAPGPFAFSDASYVRGILTDAGWDDIAFQPVDYAFIAGAGDDPVADAVSFLMSIGPAAAAARTMPESKRLELAYKLRNLLSEYRDGNLVALRAGAWIVTARANDR